MSRIDDLIAELCPNGVESRPLGDAFTMRAGNAIHAADVAAEPSDEYRFPCYGGNGLRGFVRTPSHAGLHLLIGRQGALCGNVKRADGEFYATEHAVVVAPRIDIDLDWAYHLLVKMNLNQYATKSAQPGLAVRNLERVMMPIPSLEVQRQIVRILDTFSALEAELEAELEARRRQYEHYRDSLLTFAEGESFSYVLGDLAEFKYGYTASAAPAGGYRFIRITDINASGKLSPNDARYIEASDHVEDYRIKAGDLLVARTGATYGKTMLASEDMDAVYASFLIRVRLNESRILPSFYWHFAQSGNYWRQADALVSAGGQPQFNANALKVIRLSVPPLAEQERIVAILDTFDALANDLSIGLPAELAARRTQYEHYRDRLLTFEPVAA